MLRKILWLASVVLPLLQTVVRPEGASAANVMTDCASRVLSNT
jgi:hypothetical protein